MIDQSFCEVQALCMRDGKRACAQMLCEEASKMAACDAEAIRESLDTAIVKHSAGNQPETPPHGRRCTMPRGRTWCAFRPASQARPIACLAGCRSTRVKRNILTLRRVRRANGTTVNTGRLDADKKMSIESRIARQPGPFEYLICVHQLIPVAAQYRPGSIGN